MMAAGAAVEGVKEDVPARCTCSLGAVRSSAAANVSAGAAVVRVRVHGSACAVAFDSALHASVVARSVDARCVTALVIRAAGTGIVRKTTEAAKANRFGVAAVRVAKAFSGRRAGGHATPSVYAWRVTAIIFRAAGTGVVRVTAVCAETNRFRVAAVRVA